jgi:hypothetical protein
LSHSASGVQVFRLRNKQMMVPVNEMTKAEGCGIKSSTVKG